MAGYFPDSPRTRCHSSCPFCSGHACVLAIAKAGQSYSHLRTFALGNSLLPLLGLFFPLYSLTSLRFLLKSYLV